MWLVASALLHSGAEIWELTQEQCHNRTQKRLQVLNIATQVTTSKRSAKQNESLQTSSLSGGQEWLHTTVITLADPLMTTEGDD